MTFLKTLSGVTAVLALVAALAVVAPATVSAEEHEVGDVQCVQGLEVWKVWEWDGGFWISHPFNFGSESQCMNYCNQVAFEKGTECVTEID